MRMLLVSIMIFLAAMAPPHIFAAGSDTSEVKFLLYNIADTKGQDLSKLLEKAYAGDDPSEKHLEVAPEMLANPAVPSHGEKIVSISDSGVYADEVSSLKFQLSDANPDHLMFYTKKFPDRVMNKFYDGRIIFALKKDLDRISKKLPVITKTRRASEKEKNEAFKKVLEFISDPVNEQKVVGIKEKFDPAGELSEALLKKYKTKCYRINRPTEGADLLIFELRARSKEDEFDNFMFVFERGKIVSADYEEFKFSFNFNGDDHFITKQRGVPDYHRTSRCLYSIKNGVLKRNTSEYSFTFN